ncbi:MAG: YkgJ family cysteine cluster protein [Candidatus Omnitrophota bacterium]
MIRQFVPESACLKCAGCCRFKEADSVWLPCLLNEEAQELADREGIPAVSISIDKKIQPKPNPGGEGFVCAFLGCKDNKCGVYRFRPFECQLYPFLINLRNKRVLLTVDLNCPYIKDHLNSKELNEYIDYLVSFLNSSAQIKILKNNPQLLQAYEEVSEIVELKISDEIK